MHYKESDKDQKLRRLFRVVGKDENTFTVAINAESPVLRAHFPGRPVVPGSSLVDLCERLSKRAFGYECPLAEVKFAKFSVPISPDEYPEIKVKMWMSEDMVHALFTSLSGRTLARVQYEMLF